MKLPRLNGNWPQHDVSKISGIEKVRLRLEAPEVRRPCGDPEVLAAQSRKQYYKLKNKLQVLTVSIGGIGLVSSYVTYSPEIAASCVQVVFSFGVGFLGSLLYIKPLVSLFSSLSSFPITYLPPISSTFAALIPLTSPISPSSGMMLWRISIVW